MGGGARGDGPLVAAYPAATADSPSRRLALLGQVFGCAAACAVRIGPPTVSAPAPRRRPWGSCARGRSPGTGSSAEEGTEDGYVSPESRDASVAPSLLELTGGRAIAAVEVRPDVLCPTHRSRLKVFEDYEFVAAVGSGAFGKVLKVRHRATGRHRACKAVSFCSPLERGLVDTEVAVLQSLNHPNVMRLHEVYLEAGSEQGGKVYLITELFEGGDLQFRIAYHYRTLGIRMKEGHVAYMMRQILSAAMYCHQRGLVHRDIKPNNVLFVDPGAGSPLKLIDFGLAGFAERLKEAAREVTVPRSNSLGRLAKVLPAAGARWCHVRRQMMQRAGTAYYMAPEMIQAGCYDQKADMFSIGNILCELLTGSHPFFTPEVDTAEAVQAKIVAPRAVRLPRELLEGVSSEAVDLCQRLLEKDPKRRLSASQALAHPWFRDPAKPSPYGNALIVGGTAASGVAMPSQSVREVFAALRRFRAYDKLHRAALLVMACECPDAEVREASDLFMAMNSRGDGLLSPEDLRQAAKVEGINLEDGEADLLIGSLGGASGQRAGFKEFIAALLERYVEVDVGMLRDCFLRFAEEQRGYLTFADVQRVLRGRDGSSSMGEAEWEDIVAPFSNRKEGGERKLFFHDFAGIVLADCASLRGHPPITLDDGFSSTEDSSDRVCSKKKLCTLC